MIDCHDFLLAMHKACMAQSLLSIDRVLTDWHDNQLQLLECATPASALFRQAVLEQHCSSYKSVHVDYIHLQL